MLTNVNILKMNKRFQKWLDSKNINATKLAEKIDVSKATISHILTGRNKPSIDLLNKILKKYPDFNLNWLVCGVGHMSNDTQINLIKKNIKRVLIFYDDSSFDELSK
jgi:transcriptional regulator with XRE-family HTH domain